MRVLAGEYGSNQAKHSLTGRGNIDWCNDYGGLEKVPPLPCSHFPNELVRENLRIMPFSSAVPHDRDLPAQIEHITMLIKLISELAAQVLRPENVLKTSTVSIIAHTQIISTIKHSLLSIKDSDHGPQHELPLLYVICSGKAAALISTTHYFRAMSTTSATTRSLHQRIVTALEALEGAQPDMLDIDSLKLLLW